MFFYTKDHLLLIKMDVLTDILSNAEAPDDLSERWKKHVVFSETLKPNASPVRLIPPTGLEEILSLLSCLVFVSFLCSSHQHAHLLLGTQLLKRLTKHLYQEGSRKRNSMNEMKWLDWIQLVIFLGWFVRVPWGFLSVPSSHSPKTCALGWVDTLKLPLGVSESWVWKGCCPSYRSDHHVSRPMISWIT